MRSLDTSSSLRLAVLMEMLEDVSRAPDAEAAFRAFARRIRRVRPIDAYASVSVHGLPPGDYRVMRLHRARGGEFESVTPAPKDVESLPIRRGGFVGSVINRREPQLYQDMKLATDPVLADLMSGMGSCMCVPLFQGGRIGAWSLMFRTDPRGYGIEDLVDDLLIGNLMGAMTLNMSSVERISHLNAALREQFDQVARVQKALLPAALPALPGVSFATSYHATDQAGGDYYDFFDLGTGRFGILIADVSGHGPAAATIMAMLHAMLHARPDVCTSPAGALKFASDRLAVSSIEGAHVTGVFVLLDTAAHTLIFSRAGHPIPRVRAADGSVRPLGGGSGEGAAPMGIVADGYHPRESTAALRPGDSVILYTDGITEAENPAGDQLGVEGLDLAIAAAPDDPRQIIQSIESAVRAHEGPVRGDDQTLVVFRIRE